MPITASLQRFVDDELSRAAALAEQTVQATLVQLSARPGMDNSEREQAHELAQSLGQRASIFVRAFADALQHAVHAELHHAPAGTPPAASPRGLELVDETRVESDIEIASAAQTILSAAEWELRELLTFTSTLAGQQHVSADTNPLQPQAYARALWNGVEALTLRGAPRTLLLRVAAGILAGQLKKAWAAASTRLESRGIEPGMYRTVVLAPGPRVERALSFDVTRPGGLEALLPRMPAAGATPAAVAPARAARAVGPHFRELLDRLDAHFAGTAHDRGALPRLSEHRDELVTNTFETIDRQIIELLSRLFETMLGDARLPPAFRGVIARLQVSALRVALEDPSMLAVHDHPVWRLMNRLASAAETYTRTTDPRWTALLAYCDKLVGEISQAPVHDALLYKLSLSRLDAFLNEQLREQQQQAQSNIDALMHIEQRDELEREISQRLTGQLQPLHVPAGVRRFITGAWARVLADSMARRGERAQTTLELMKSTDDLLWSLRPPDHPQSRKRMLAMLPGLLQSLRSGLAAIGVPAHEQQAMLDELMALHTEALRPGAQAVDDQAAVTAQDIVQRMRDETDWQPSSRPSFSDSLIDLGSMETVPADILTEPASPLQRAVAHVDTIWVGSRHHIFLHGRWTRVQLLWRSPQGLFFLFASADQTHPHSVTHAALERLAEEGLVKPLDDVPLVQRAVDALLPKLAPAA